LAKAAIAASRVAA
jgi:Phage integrase family